MADLEHDVRITPSTVFDVASLSKQFTAAAVLLLVHQGKLSLAEDIRKYIPELPAYKSRITVRDLIQHTSGLRDQWTLLDLAGWRYPADLITDEEILSILKRQNDLNFSPGSRYEYSNTDYTLLALIVARVSGVSFREFTTQNIFVPLGMKNSHFRDNHTEIVRNIAYGYERSGGRFHTSTTNTDTVGATGLLTTVEDLALWDENFYLPRIGGRDFASEMLEPGKLNDGEKLDYAFGLMLGKYKGLITIDHPGADPGYLSDLMRFPDQHFSVAVLCNSRSADPIALIQEIADVYLAQEMSEVATAGDAPKFDAGEEVQLTARELSSVVGLYWDRDDDQYLKLYIKDGKLHELAGGGDALLKPLSSTHFQFASQPYINVTLKSPAHGSRRILQSFKDQKPQVYELAQEVTPSSSALREYAGDYMSSEIGAVYHITLQESVLKLAWPKHRPIALQPRTRDAFSSSLGTFHFTRSGNRAVSGFTFDTSGVRNVRFARLKTSG